MRPVWQRRARPEAALPWTGSRRSALLILLLSAALARWIDAMLGPPPGLLSTVWLQAGLAAVLSLCLAQPWWWLLINASFAPGVHYTRALHWPPWLFLLALLLLCLGFGAMFLTRVPLFPSRPAVWALVEALLPADRAGSVLDMGSGLGGFCLHLAECRPNCQVRCIEWAFLPWLLSQIVRAQV